MNPNVMAMEALDSLLDESHNHDLLKRDFRVDIAHLSFIGTDKGVRIRVPDQSEEDMKRQGAIWKDYSPQSGMSGFERPPIQRLDAPAEFSPREDVWQQIYEKLAPVHWQKASRTGTIPADFMGRFSHHDRADVLNMIKNNAPRGKSWMVRTYADGARAVLDGDYPRTWNSEIIAATREVLSQSEIGNNPVLPRPRVNEDNAYIRLYWDNSGTDEGGGLKVGLIIANGETGDSATKLLPMIYRGECTNGIVFESIDNKRQGIVLGHHRSRSPHVMMQEFVGQFPYVMKVSADAIDRMLQAQKIIIPDFHYVLEGLRIEHGWSKDVLSAVDEGTEKQNTLFGIVNGITWAAHQGKENAKGEFAMERLGGKYLFADLKVFELLAAQGRKGEKTRALVG